MFIIRERKSRDDCNPNTSVMPEGHLEGQLGDAMH